MSIEARISGVQDIDRVFLALPGATQNKASRPALRAGGRVIRDMASANVKAITSDEATGLLARSLRVYALRRFKGNLRVGVQVKRGAVAKNGARVGLYASVLEYGKEGQPPRSWLRKAIREGVSSATSAVVTEFNKRLVDAVRAAGGK